MGTVLKMGKRPRKNIKEVASRVAEGLLKIWLCGRAYRVNKDVFEQVIKAESERAALQLVEKFLNKEK